MATLEVLPMPDPLPTASTDPRPLALVPRVDQARHDVAQAQAAPRRRSDRAGGQHVVRWCAAHTRAPLPATPQPLVLSRTARAAQVTPGTLASRVAASRVAHQQRGHARPTTHPLVRDVLSGIRRTRGTRPGQVQGLTRDRLTRLLQAPGDRLRDRRHRALLAVASDLLARRSGSSRQGCASNGVQVPIPSIARFRRLAYPGHGEVTTYERLGWKSHGCNTVYAVSVGAIWVASTPVGLNMKK